MSDICDRLHKLLQAQEVLDFPFDGKKIPRDGIYIIYELGEMGHGGYRITRIGTHTGVGQLRSRLKQHFVKENKDRSIFRKNVGRALLNRDDDPFLDDWNQDLTSSEAKKLYAHLVGSKKQKAIEKQVSEYIQCNLSFSVLEVPDKDQRLEWEKKIISTVSLCEECRPSSSWLGQYSPKKKIREGGLWQVNELYKEPLSSRELDRLHDLLH